MVSPVEAAETPVAPKMDTARLRTHVFEQTGIRIDTSDPVFALVALNDAVLADGVQRQRAVLDEAAERLHGQADELLEAGERFKRQVQRSGGVRGDAPAGEAAPASRAALVQLAAVGAGTAVLAAVLTVAGVAMFAKPAAVPAAAAGGEPAALTAEQILNMQNGEKFVKVMSKLDGKTQARILELMRQP